MVKEKYVPDKGDVVWIDLSPTRGHEQANLRPVLVLSPIKYNERTNLMVACAITSRIKGYSYEVPLSEEKVDGVVLSDQMRNLDWKSRKVRFIQKVSTEVIEEVSENIKILLFR
ncbi:endoribonuclease MazF [Candidatus Kaiserbacteria bacterium]|nr:MAG: endoribonuclease MazF [Candidatus Kaiserbacteria bacterium]